MKFVAEAWDLKTNSRWQFAGTSDETKITAYNWQEAIDIAFERFALTKHAMPTLRPTIMIVRSDTEFHGTSYKRQGFGFRAKQEAVRWAGQQTVCDAASPEPLQTFTEHP
jgi:hypothetical protein